MLMVVEFVCKFEMWMPWFLFYLVHVWCFCIHFSQLLYDVSYPFFFCYLVALLWCRLNMIFLMDSCILCDAPSYVCHLYLSGLICVFYSGFLTCVHLPMCACLNRFSNALPLVPTDLFARLYFCACFRTNLSCVHFILFLIAALVLIQFHSNCTFSCSLIYFLLCLGLHYLLLYSSPWIGPESH